MVESSVGGGGGSCRCACQEDFNGPDEEDDPSRGCCGPQVFTSVLLGVLACVLMTGGVFLAFHRWDPLWLIVSGIGVVLVLIGSILHCCSTSEPVSRTRGRQAPSGGKGGCCGRPVQNEHHHMHGHLVANGSLTEQLLPLSNARSVSQLSLNMLPGYFPPVVTTYGIEQHSAVVQNINRIVQQQQLQTQQSTGSGSPGVQQGGGAGKSFILLSLPGDTTQANIQNLVATVYQMDGNSSAAETLGTDVTSAPPPAPAASIPSPAASPIPPTPPPLLFKSVEVQTCSLWPNMSPNSSPAVSNNILQNTASSSTSTEVAHLEPCTQLPSTITTASGVTQTEDIQPTIDEHINLMDCSADIPPICDNSNQTPESSALVNIPESSVLVDVSEPQMDPVPLQSALVVDIPQTSNDNLLDLATPTTVVEVDRTASCSADVSDVLIDISDGPAIEVPVSDTAQPTELIVNITPSDDLVVNVNSDDTTQAEAFSNQLHVEVGSSELSLSCSNLSDIDGEEVDDSELLERSSPPPSYDDATHEGESAIGAFGLAYGTI